MAGERKVVVERKGGRGGGRTAEDSVSERTRPSIMTPAFLGRVLPILLNLQRQEAPVSTYLSKDDGSSINARPNMGGGRPDRAESLPVWAGTVDRGSRGMGNDLCGEMHVKPLERFH